MSAVFASETLGPTERLVMLSLADHANEHGQCYPSISRLCRRTGLGERAVQNHIKSLVAQGYLTVIPNAGPNGTNVFYVRTVAEPKPEIAAGGSARFPDAHGRFAIYRRDNHTCVYCGYLSPDGEQNLTLDHILPQSRGGGHEPENLVTACMDCNRKKKGRTPFEWLGDDCPPHLMPPAGSASRTKCASTPASRSKTPAPDAPKPSITIIEPPEGKERAGRAPDQSADVRRALIDAGATPAAVTSFLSHYRAKVRKPLSLVGAERLAGTLRTIIDSGGDADDALGLAEERGWQSIKADWYFREKANGTDGTAGHRATDRPQNRPDAALEQIARLARARPAPGYGRA